MPTGYTAAVVDGNMTEFPQFALQCARAFGALIMMRDDAMDAPIPEKFKPSDYNLLRLAEAKAKMAELRQMTTEQLAEAALRDYDAKIASRKKYREQQELENQRLADMETKVRDWQPPSANHTEMKNFMLEQLRISKHDIGSIDRYDPPPILKAASEWLRDQIEETQRNIGYHAGEWEKEVERTAGRNEWVQQLRDSLQSVS